MSGHLIDLTGLRYGDYTVIWYAGQKRWQLRCTCGARIIAFGQKIRENRARRTCNHKGDDRTMTARETEIAQLVAHGMPNKEIAAQLVISERTVRTHLENIFDKLNLRNRTELAMIVQIGKLT